MKGILVIKLLKEVVFLVTGNVHKLREARLALGEFGLSIVMLNVETAEIQADSVVDVAEVSAVDAARKCCLPVIVEDAGLFVQALGGFPGPYSSYVFRTIGREGILKLMKNVEKRNAFFESAVAAYAPEWKAPRSFHGKVEGKITERAIGQAGFGFDPIFVPEKGDGKTFAEMSMAEKNRYSHRAEALRRFASWYVSEF